MMNEFFRKKKKKERKRKKVRKRVCEKKKRERVCVRQRLLNRRGFPNHIELAPSYSMPHELVHGHVD